MATKSDWEARFARETRPVSEPDEFLFVARPHIPVAESCCAVDLACGGGRHAIQLARWGLRTLAVDWSEEALRLCGRRAAFAGVDLETRLADLEHPAIDLGSEQFDVVAVFNFLHRPLIPVLKRSVRRGGVVVYKTYTRDQRRFARGPSNPRYLLEKDELPELFSDFRRIVYQESCKSEATAALVAQRP